MARASQHTRSATGRRQRPHQRPPGHAAAGNDVADVLLNLYFVLAHAQWRAATRAAPAGALHQGAAVRWAPASSFQAQAASAAAKQLLHSHLHLVWASGKHCVEPGPDGTGIALHARSNG